MSKKALFKKEELFHLVVAQYSLNEAIKKESWFSSSNCTQFIEDTELSSKLENKISDLDEDLIKELENELKFAAEELDHYIIEYNESTEVSSAFELQEIIANKSECILKDWCI